MFATTGLVCASTPGVDEMSEGQRPMGVDAMGLVPGHAYTIVQARVIERGPYRGAQVLMVRHAVWGSRLVVLSAWRDGLAWPGLLIWL